MCDLLRANTGTCYMLSLLHLLLQLRALEAVGLADLQQLVEDKTIPLFTNGSALDLHLGFYIESVSNFRAHEMTFDVDLYVYTSWRDPRMAHNSKEDLVLISEKNARDMMWLPDLYFANARHCKFQEVTVPNFNLFVARDGLISYSLRATCSISCSLNLVNYPMDKQHCFIRMISYAHTTERLRVRWFTEAPIRKNPEIGLPEFFIKEIKPDYCEGTYRYAITEHSHKTGNFSCLMASIFLERSLGYNLVQSYIPTGLIVMISWVSFFIDRRAVPARVTLSFTTLVSLTTLGNGLRYDLPQVSYSKALDLWYGACLMFVFASLIEFAAVNSYMRKCDKYCGVARQLSRRIAKRSRVTDSGIPVIIPARRRRTELLKERNSLIGDEEELNFIGLQMTPSIRRGKKQPTIAHYTRTADAASRVALKIDVLSRVAFPVTFLVFNLTYWTYYQSQ